VQVSPKQSRGFINQEIASLPLAMTWRINGIRRAVRGAAF
jgi:hypothetical protein